MPVEGMTNTDPVHAEKAGFALLKNQTEAITGLQRDLLLTCEEIGEEWTSRLQSEAALWSELIDDSRRVVEDCQRMAQKVSDALNNGLHSRKARPGVNHSGRRGKRKQG